MELIRSALNKVRNILARGIVRLINDAQGVQRMQVTLMANEVSDDVEHPQEYGFTSLAPENSEHIAAFFNGDRDHGVILTVFNRGSRPKAIMAVGDVMLYDNHGNKIWLKEGEIFIEHATKVTIQAPLTQITGNLQVGGHIESAGYIHSGSDILDNVAGNTKSMANMRTTYNEHTHQEHDGPNTNPPNQPI